MTVWAALALAVGVAATGIALVGRPLEHPEDARGEKPWALVVSGDTDGYLSPCGCTSPMTGGIRRRATAIERLQASNRIVLIDDGGFGGAPDAQGTRQSEMKADTMAQTFASLDAAAVHLTARDARLGVGELDQVERLSGGRLVSSNLTGGPIAGIQRFVQRGPFTIGGYSVGIGAALGAPERTLDETAAALLEQAGLTGLMAVLMVDGSRDLAADVARRYPALAAVVYRRSGWPPDTPDKVGHVWLLTPGERGKSIVRATSDGKRFTGYFVTRLGPEFADDRQVSSLYRTYLARIDASNLLDEVPRFPSAAFAGSQACARCHPGASAAWQASGHAHALTTLEKQGHGRDPDCVSCHVVGLERAGGFRSRSQTPTLASVGCEACHGPAAAHLADPDKSKMPKLGDKVCFTCHTPDQSPGFDFLTFWPKVAHGLR